MWLTTCAPRLSRRLGHQGQVLTGGAMPAPGPRPASAALRGRGLAHATAFQQSPRGVTRALWSRLAGARLWRLLLVPTPAPRGPLGLGGEAPPGGAQSGPRPRPCAGARCSPPPGQRAWGAGGAPAALGSRALGQARLGLAVRDGPRARRARAAGPRHQELTAWARQRPRVVRRGRPARALGGGPERSVAGLARRWRRRQGPPLWGVTRVRREAARDAPAPPREPRPTGRPRLPGQRLPPGAPARWAAATGWPTVRGRRGESAGARQGESASAPAGRETRGPCEPQAWLGTARTVAPSRRLAWCGRRRRLAGTGQAARAPRGVGPHRAGQERALARTPPALSGPCSRVTLMAGRWAHAPLLPVRPAVWGHNSLPPVVEAIAMGRQHGWASTPWYRSPGKAALVAIPCALLTRVPEPLCSAASWTKSRRCASKKV